MDVNIPELKFFSIIIFDFRSMDELDPHEDTSQGPRPSVKELVARIQQQHQNSSHNDGPHSESSDDEDGPLRMPSRKGLMGDPNGNQVI